MKSGYFVKRPRRVILYNCCLIATDSNYLRCPALLTSLHFPLETTWSCKQNRKERYWGQQFWQMERDISVRPTETSKLVPNIPVGQNRNGPFHLMYQPKLPELWVEWKAPQFSRSDRLEFWLACVAGVRKGRGNAG